MLSHSFCYETLTIHVEKSNVDTGTQTDELDARIVDTGTQTDELDARIVDTGTQTDELDARIVDTGTQTDELDARSKVDLGKYTIFSTPHQYVHCLTVIFISPSQSLQMLLTATQIPMPIMIVLMKSTCN